MALCACITFVAGWISADQTGALSASAGTPTQLSNAVSDQALADALRTPNTRAVLVPDNSALITEGAALARMADAALVIVDSTTAAASVITRLDALGATSLYLLASAGSFSANFKTSVAAGRTIVADIADNSAFVRSTVAASTSASHDSVVASKDDLVATRLAVAEAISSGTPLILLEGNETRASLEAFFHPRADGVVTVVGATSVLDPSVLSADQEERLGRIAVDSPGQVAFDTAVRSFDTGINGRKLVSAPSDSSSTTGIAALYAWRAGSLFAPAGTLGAFSTASAAHEVVRAWQSELTSLELVGVGVTPAMLSDLAAPTSIARMPAPAWSVTASSVVGANQVISTTTVAGATSYQALQLNDQVLATSSTPTLTFPLSAGAATHLYARNASGAIIHSIAYRQNDHANGVAGALVGTILGTTHSIAWQSTKAVPRLVKRTPTDPFYRDPTAFPGDPARTEVVAITCNPALYDGPLDLSMQWSYEVVELTSSGVTCGSTSSPGSSRISGLVTLPAMAPPPEWGTAKVSARGIAVEGVDPGYTMFDMAIERSRKASESVRSEGTTAARTAQPSDDTEPGEVRTPRDSTQTEREVARLASTMPTTMIFYEQYIPEDKIWVPGFSGDLLQPAIAFHGDGREWYELNGGSDENHRVLTNGFFSFGPTHTALVSAHIGETIKYKCAFLTAGCSEVERKRANLAESVSYSAVSGENSAEMSIDVHAAIPLYPGPAINGNMDFKLRPGGSTVKGSHDLMPVHQIWVGNYNADAYLVYRNNFYYPVCLAGALGGPFCTASVNAQF